MTGDRSRLGVLVALCSLAGVVVGFGLSNMAASMRSYHCPSMHARNVQVVAAAPIETPTWLGVRITPNRGGGVYVQQVEGSSPARAAGIQAGDVITGFAPGHCTSNIRPVRSVTGLVRMVRSADVGEGALVMLRRDGETQIVRAQLDRMPMSLYIQERR